jgi:hypothetical protein
MPYLSALTILVYNGTGVNLPPPQRARLDPAATEAYLALVARAQGAAEIDSETPELAGGVR